MTTAQPQQPQQPPTPDPFASLGGGTYNPQTGHWLPPGMSEPGMAPAAPAAPAAAPAAPAPVTGPQTGATPQTIQGAYQDAMQRILSGPTPEAYAQGAAQGPEAAAYRLARNRQLERDRQQNALSSAYGGTSNVGGLDRALKGQAAEGEAQFVGQLTGQRMNERRQELMAAMQLAAAQGDAAAARALQQQLAQMDAALREKGLGVQERLGSADIDTRMGIARMDDATRQLLGKLGIGFDYARLGVDANANALAQILGA